MARVNGYSVKLLAFLDLIAWSEIGPAMLADPQTDDGYKVLVGSLPGHLKLFQDYTHHPHVINPALDSSAAGRYQIIYPTFSGLDLPDFSPESQDLAAIKLIARRGAIDAIVSDNLTQAVHLCSQEWASFPGNNYNQPGGHTMSELAVAYMNAVQTYK